MSAKRCFSCETSSLGLWLLPGFMQSLSNHFFHTKQTCELRTSASAPILDLRHKLAKVGFNLLTLFPIARLQVTDQPCLPSIGREAETNLRKSNDTWGCSHCRCLKLAFRTPYLSRCLPHHLDSKTFPL